MRAMDPADWPAVPEETLNPDVTGARLLARAPRRRPSRRLPAVWARAILR